MADTEETREEKGTGKAAQRRRADVERELEDREEEESADEPPAGEEGEDDEPESEGGGPGGRGVDQGS